MKKIMIRILKCFFGTVLLFILVACEPAPESEKPTGILRIATIPTDMPIMVNGHPKGNSPPGEGQYFTISLNEGEHAIEIQKAINEEKEHYAKKTLFVARDVRRHINCHRFKPGLRETLLTSLIDIKRRLCGIASVDVGLSFV